MEYGCATLAVVQYYSMSYSEALDRLVIVKYTLIAELHQQ